MSERVYRVAYLSTPFVFVVVVVVVVIIFVVVDLTRSELGRHADRIRRPP